VFTPDWRSFLLGVTWEWPDDVADPIENLQVLEVHMM